MSASCLYDVRHACVRLTIASEESAKCLPCAAVPFTGILHIRTEPHNLEHETRYLHSIHRTHRGQIFLVVELVTRYAGRRVRYDGLLETRSPKGFRAMALAGCYNDHHVSNLLQHHGFIRSDCSGTLHISEMPNVLGLDVIANDYAYSPRCVSFQTPSPWWLLKAPMLLPGYPTRYESSESGPGPVCLSSPMEQTV